MLFLLLVKCDDAYSNVSKERERNRSAFRSVVGGLTIRTISLLVSRTKSFSYLTKTGSYRFLDRKMYMFECMRYYDV
jgi:hypothetical protein